MILGVVLAVGATLPLGCVSQSVAMPIKHHNEIKAVLPVAPVTGLYLSVD